MRCRALGRDRKYQEQQKYFIDYVTFCNDMEPKTGGRDLDNRSGWVGTREIQRVRVGSCQQTCRGEMSGLTPISCRVKHSWGL